MLVTWCSTTGAPGVSSWSVLTSGLWPADGPNDVVVVEADRSGGVMASRYGLGVSPGSAELVVAASDGDALDLAAIARRVSERAWLVPAPVVPAESAAVWNDTNVAQVARLAAGDPRTWFADVGRYHPSTWLWHEQSALTVVLVPAWTDALVSAQSVIAELRSVGATRVLVVGKPEYDLAELGTFFECDVALLPTAKVVEESTSVWGGGGWWRRGQVWDAASRLAADLFELGVLAGGV